ncbi:MAG TPA: hypothetical protein VFQ53_26780 [Kofleriaceae bacterium]|nr:hypothetical protein [Kofleriaceae bacterium]
MVLLASMFIAWIDVGGHTQSGLGIAWEQEHWMFLVPIAGGLLAAAAATRSQYTRLAAVAAGMSVAGVVIYQFARGILHSGLDTWLILGGAGVILAGVSSARRGWRIAGGVAVLAGFFAPWTDDSMWRLLRSDELEFLTDGLGVTVRVLWFVPVAAIAAIGSGASASAKSGRTALIAGCAIYGAVLWVLGSMFNMVLGWGAWAALGASTVALVLGVLAGSRREA